MTKKKVLKIALIALAVIFLAAQAFRPDQTNPPINPGDNLEAATSVPADVQAILSRSCKDCHTHNTVYPWYSQVSPASWFLADHISDGRRHLNFSVWNTYSTDKKGKKLEEICEQVESGEMPLPSYLWLHRDAALDPSEVRVLCDWSNAEAERVRSVGNL